MHVFNRTWNQWQIYILKENIVLRTLPESKKIFTLIEEDGHTHIAIDISGTPYIDSNAITHIINLQKKLSRLGGEVVIFGPNAEVREIFSLVSLESVIKIFDTQPQFEQYASESPSS